MSVLNFLRYGGAAMTGGDLPSNEQAYCNRVLKVFANHAQHLARNYQIPAATLRAIQAQALLVAKDKLTYHFLLIFTGGQNQITYRDFAAHERIDLRQLIHQVRIESGDVVAAFSVPVGRIQSIQEVEINNIAADYVQTVMNPTTQSGLLAPEALAVPDLTSFIQSFRADHPQSERTAFIMMQFQATSHHEQILQAIRNALSAHGIIALRADDKIYADDLLANIRTYMHCVDFGIAIFERIESDAINPNVSLETGYMMGLLKPVCLLKERTLKMLQSDLVGRLYREFSVSDVDRTISNALNKWLSDKGLIDSAR